MRPGNYKLFNNDKHFSLEYIRYPIQMAYQVLLADLAKVDSSKEYRIVRNRWRLAALKFYIERRHMLIAPVMHGAISKAEEYEYYLNAAYAMLNDKEVSLRRVSEY